MKKLILALLLTSSLDANAVGFADPSRIWDKTTLTTCFVDRVEELQDDRIALRLEEDRNFKAERFISFPSELIPEIETSVVVSFATTPLRFIGWKNCSDTESADIYITYSLHESVKLAAGCVGNPEKCKFSDSKKTKTSIRINKGFIDYYKTKISDEALRRKSLQVGIIHEFAHIAGIWHEHLRSDVLDVSRKMDLSGYDIADELYETNKEHSRSNVKEIGAFDGLSVTNYFMTYLILDLDWLRTHCKSHPELTACDLKKIERLLPHLDPVRGYLSKGDIETINYLYLGTPVTNSWLEESNLLMNWLNSIKEIASGARN